MAPDPKSEDALERFLARIEATAEKIRQGVGLFDPDEVGRDLIEEVVELDHRLARLMGEDGDDKESSDNDRPRRQ